MTNNAQLSQVNLQDVFPQLDSETLDERMALLVAISVQQLGTEELSLQLTDQQQEILDRVIKQQAALPEADRADAFDLLTLAFPDFPELLQAKILENKEEAIRGQVALLQMQYEDDEEAQNLLDDIEQQMDQGEWLAVAAALKEMQSIG